MDKSLDINEWLRRAKSNLTRAKMTITEDILLEDMCFDAQQAAEKSLKALIIHLGLTFHRTHYLNELIQIIQKRMIVPDFIKPCVKLNNYAVTTRYPDDYVEVTEEEYKEAVEIAERVYNWVVENIK